MPRRTRTQRTRTREHEDVDDMTFPQLMERRGIAPTSFTTRGRRVYRIHPCDGRNG